LNLYRRENVKKKFHQFFFPKFIIGDGHTCT
jgi:hypothetical protein